MGTGHLNDHVLTTPVFLDGKPVALFSCTSHITDIGGIGTTADATDVHMEGLYIPMLKICDQGVPNATLLAMIKRNTRQPIETAGDIYSLLACNEVGKRRLLEMMAEYRLNSLDELGDFILATSKRAVEEEIARLLPAGNYSNEMMVDGEGELLGRAGVLLKCTVSVIHGDGGDGDGKVDAGMDKASRGATGAEGSKILVDYSGTSARSKVHTLQR
jgi:N-methylhydantoinase B